MSRENDLYFCVGTNETTDGLDRCGGGGGGTSLYRLYRYVQHPRKCWSEMVGGLRTLVLNWV